MLTVKSDAMWREFISYRNLMKLFVSKPDCFVKKFNTVTLCRVFEIAEGNRSNSVRHNRNDL